MTHCVYRHIRPDTNEVFYVGMTTKGKNLVPTEIRRKNAMGNKGSSGNIWINNGKISKYLKDGIDIPDGWNRGRMYKRK